MRAGHRVKGVRDREQPAFEGDGLLSQAVGVAAPVGAPAKTPDPARDLRQSGPEQDVVARAE